MNILDDAPPTWDPGTGKNPNYPLGGKVTGPAWRAAWHILRNAETPLSGRVIAGEVADITGAHPDTVLNILISAARHGVLDTVKLPEVRNNGTWYVTGYKRKG